MKKTVWIIPHSHYDAEVFLVEKETLEIGYSALVGALRLMRTDPTYKFTLDQSCLIDPFLRTYPEEREFFQQMIDAGRLEIAGGMYIMPDVNMPSGESFIRQVLFGKQYIEKELKVDVRNAWTLDSFGRHPQMPQLLVKCGYDHDTFSRLGEKDGPAEFFYEGLDGSRIFCSWMHSSYAIFYFSPSNFYEFKKYALERIRRLESHSRTKHLMAPAGADLTPVEAQIPGFIAEYNRIQSDYDLRLATPAEFFQAVKALEAPGSEFTFPTIKGDLNPVFQGCYSARIDIKQWNRKLENLLVSAEKFSAAAQLLGEAAPKDGLWDAWKGVLFNQFHDIMCGSHVDSVFHNTMDRFKISQALTNERLSASLQAIGDQIDTSGAGTALVVFNPLSWERTDIAEFALAYSQDDTFEIAVVNPAGEAMPADLREVERYENGAIKRARVLFVARGIPAFGYETFHAVPAAAAAVESGLTTSHNWEGLLRFELDNGWLENEFYRVELNLWNGLITRIYDKVNQWDVLSTENPTGNSVVKERDFGNFWQYNGPCKGDALYPMTGRYPLPGRNDTDVDFAHTYLGDGNIHNGKAMAQFSINHPYGKGHYSTRVRLYAGIPRIDIQTTLLNNDERVRYRAAFPTSIQAGTITYEIPFGAIERPEGEYPAQNWVDYSAAGRGVTLLNFGLPGNNVVDGVMLLSLLKCTAIKEGYGEAGGFKLSTPTEEGYEKGMTHTFDYALMPHGGDWRTAEATRRGMEFNNPLICWKPIKKAGRLPSRMSFISVQGPADISAVKPTPGGIIVRLYESTGQPADVVLETFLTMEKAVEVNMLEKEDGSLPLDVHSKRLPVHLNPFEIKTIKIMMGG